jgi:nucleoid-associated protein YgaU
MRKDVKFGLTVGAILVVTIIVYVMVLSHSGQAIKSEEALNAPTSPDASPAPAPTEDQTPAAPAAPDNATPTDNAPTPDVAAPATQPTADANRPFDWDQALSNGSKIPAEAPERTDTPTVDRISPDVHPALIDNIPSTQPYLPPTLSAAAPNPLPAVIQPPAPTATPPTSSSRTHVVAEGESLWTISEAVYGNGAYYTRIITANPNLDPKHLKVGTTLSIPAPSDAQTTSAASITPPATKLDMTSQYQVISGDSLDKIAQKLYGDPTMADKLYAANRTQIGDDEDRLKVGWILKLPTPPTQKQ